MTITLVELKAVKVGDTLLLSGIHQRVIAVESSRMLDLPWTHLTLAPPTEILRSVYPTSYSGYARSEVTIVQ